MPFFGYVLIVATATYAVLALIYGPRRAWAIWRRFGHWLGDALARVVLTVFYFTVFIPFALIARLTQDPLARKATQGPLWQPVVSGSDDLDAARRQF